MADLQGIRESACAVCKRKNRIMQHHSDSVENSNHANVTSWHDNRGHIVKLTRKREWPFAGPRKCQLLLVWFGLLLLEKTCLEWDTHVWLALLDEVCPCLDAT